MINKKDVDLLENIYNILVNNDNNDIYILGNFKEYVTKQKVAYMNALDKKRRYINEKRKTNPMYARSKTEIERYNAIHGNGVE